MALTNRDRIGKALDETRDALLPYISDLLSKNLGTSWENELPNYENNLQDIHILFGLFIKHWRNIFKKTLSDSARAYISELKEARNKWAHSEPISSDDVDRYLDTEQDSQNINAVDQAKSIRKLEKN